MDLKIIFFFMCTNLLQVYSYKTANIFHRTVIKFVQWDARESVIMTRVLSNSNDHTA